MYPELVTVYLFFESTKMNLQNLKKKKKIRMGSKD